MKFFVIPPIKHLSLTKLGNAGYFCLGHLYIANKEYRDFFLKVRENPNSFILLDTGTAEDACVTEDILIDICIELQPNEVIAPDILFNKNETLENLTKFIKRMDNERLLNKIKIHAVPQAENDIDWIDCYLSMLKNIHVNTIGLSKISVPKCFANGSNDQLIKEGRNSCIQYLSDKSLIVKPLHLLGAGDPLEYNYYNSIHPVQQKFLRSTDSCICPLSAINNIEFGEGAFQRVPTPHLYFDFGMNEEDINLTIHNAAYLKGLLSTYNTNNKEEGF